MTKEDYLKAGERFDDLERNGLVIIQNPEKFCFGMDAVLLSGFAKAGANAQVCDMCTGTGIIPILMSAKTDAKHFDALEIQEESADMARRSVLANELQDRINIITGDIKKATALLGKSRYDVVTVNPPYMKSGNGLVNPEDDLAIARHEILCSLEDVVREAAGLLKTGGHLFMVHRPQRLADIFSELEKYKMEPKRLKMVQATKDKKPSMILVDAVKNGGRELIVEAPVIIYDELGEYSEEIRTVYGY